MLDANLLYLAYLLQTGYTHLDLKNIFPTNDISYAEKLWQDTLRGAVDHSVTPTRQERIYVKAKWVEVDKIRIFLEEKNVQIITFHDSLYPARLRTIGHAPAFLYVRGTLRETLPPLIGVVGSRKHTPYAKRILEKILPDIIQAGVWTISGGALGVDTMWHDITLTHGGYTIAVFGTGIDRCYPAENKRLFESILEKWWALISHFPFGTAPDPYNFPIRNEIVAGISNGVLIPEAGLSSGTIITAQLALEHGRDVFVVPWDIDRATSEGSNMLIASGQGKCVRCAEDILEEYFDVEGMREGMTPVVKIPPVFVSNIEKIVYEAIESWSSRVDDIARSADLPMTDTLMTLTMLEIGGYISLDEMGRYQIQ